MRNSINEKVFVRRNLNFKKKKEPMLLVLDHKLDGGSVAIKSCLSVELGLGLGFM